MWRVVFAVVLLVCYSESVLAQDSGTKPATRDEGMAIALSPEQERDFFDKSAKALIKNSPEVVFVMTKLGPNPKWPSLLASLIKGPDFAPNRSPVSFGDYTQFAYREVSSGTAGEIKPSPTPKKNLSSESIEQLPIDRHAMVSQSGPGESPTSSKQPSKLNRTEQTVLLIMLRNQCGAVGEAYKSYVKEFAKDDSEASLQCRADRRTTLVKFVGEDVVQDLDKMLNEAKSKS